MLSYLSIISFTLVSTAGSDTGLTKMLYIFICFMPFILSKAQFNISKNIITLLLFIVLHLFVLFEFYRTFEDVRPHKATQTVQVDYLKHIKTTQERATFIENVLAEYYTLKNDSTKIVFYGQNAHIFRYLTNEEIIKTSFRMKFPSDFLELENVILKHNPIVFHTPTYPEDYEYYSNTALDSMLLKENYSKIIKDKYNIFVPN